MSYDLQDWASEEACTGSTLEWAVLQVLARAHNMRTGRCNPSIAFIARTIRAHRTAVIRALQALEAAGTIAADKRVGLATQYSFPPVAQSDQSPRATGSAKRPHQSLRATAPVAQSDPNKERTRKEQGSRPRAMASDGRGTPARLLGRIEAAGHPEPVARLLGMVASQWPVLAERHVDLEDSAGAWRRLCGGLDAAEVEAGLAWLARQAEPVTTPAAVLAAIRARLGPKRSPRHAEPPDAAPSPVVWDEVCATLGRELTAADFKTWIRPLQPRLHDRGTTLRLLAPNRYVLEHVSSNFLGRIRELAALHGEVGAVKLAVGSQPRRASSRPRGRPAERAG